MSDGGKDKKVPGKDSDGLGDLYNWEGERRKGGQSQPGGFRVGTEAGQEGSNPSCSRTWRFPCDPAPPGESHGIGLCQTGSLGFGVLMESSR